ncbi:sporulation-specific 71 family protein [Aspergillus clavatus NRRL 1]|uniref:PH domain protein n=1 Tax=Aspergillus clavatus (strain ATCC 1007 / CBS 513.65 / DSM 816 / NCTC 3887 / NRRL 1 / QM 1276 / 107) TaxID=344612 RepID=A1CLB3_ASPCL|nr:PH domain protein [Aspergillus clavatus NRRL 1]EAW09937.1 PH domain protein [Aspergillus clavatus NRRL 1]
MDTNPETELHEELHGLEPGSFTAEKLRYASAHHLHMTSRRFFIGPIPEGWLQHHRKHWYRTRLKFRNYTSRTVTFSADLTVAQSPDQSDQEQISSAAREDSTPLIDTIIQKENGDTSRDEEEDDQGPAGQPADLQAIPYPLVEAAEVPSRDPSDTDSISTGKQPESNDVPVQKKKDAASTYFTARESNSGPVDLDYHSGTADSRRTLSIPGQHDASQSIPMALPSESGSTIALMKPRSSPKGKQRLSTLSSTALERQEPQSEREDDLVDLRQVTRNSRTSFNRKVARYRYDDKLRNRQQRLLSRVANTYDVLSGTRRHRRRLREGEIIKCERMLVRIEETVQKELPEDYTETDSLRMETRVADSWKEYLVVCRLTSDEEAPVTLQMYKTRVIPEIQKPGSRVKAYDEIPLNRRNTKINLYSSLDKTIVIWRPCKNGTKIHLMRPKSTAHATEWFTFISQVLGRQRPSSLTISVPGLGVSLVFQNPFEQLKTKPGAQDEEGAHTGDTLERYASQDSYAAAAIIRGCMKMLENCTEWVEVLSEWSKTEQMGLAWKRYDRLEWVLGVNEEKMYGSLAMQTTHQLQLRPRQHYQTFVKDTDVKTEEPHPVEGFLVRLTSQMGVHQRLNKMFFKRLYFFTQDHYLLFCRPAKALPPAPPKLCPGEDSIPSARQILKEMPLSYDVNPYPIQDGEITWLSSGNEVHIKEHDQEARALAQRSIHNLTNAEGFIDLCRVQEVRQVQRGSCPADPNIQEGPDVEFHPETEDTHRDDGATKQFDDDRTLELVLDNGLVVRLQAYDMVARDEWMRRLEALVKYWKARVAADSYELKAIRKQNLEILDMDEEMESMIGQSAEKWESKKSEASPFLHNICALAGCRIIKMSGQLYRKPRRHSTFKKCDVILAAGKLLIFRSSLRNRTGVEIPHIHQNLETALDLEDCYIYSGLVTESDLLYANQTFDSNHPGHRALPRIYLSSDVYTSCDEDTAITFVVWQPLRKNYFRAQELGKKGQTKQTLKQVSTLGVPGRTVVFKARSRVERDRWVMSIASEIDRLQEEKPQDIRLIRP